MGDVVSRANCGTREDDLQVTSAVNPPPDSASSSTESESIIRSPVADSEEQEEEEDPDLVDIPEEETAKRTAAEERAHLDHLIQNALDRNATKTQKLKMLRQMIDFFLDDIGNNLETADEFLQQYRTAFEGQEPAAPLPPLQFDLFLEFMNRFA